MGVDILSVLRNQKLSHIKRSIAATEGRERKVANAATATSAMLNGNMLGDGKHLEEYKLRDCYVRALEAYNRKSIASYSWQPFNPRGLALWKRVSKAWRTSGVSPETFIQAQFTYFHDHFRRAPETKDLTTEAAVVRAASVAPRNVVTNDIQADINTAELFRCCEKQMTDLMRAQKMTREEVYKKLVLPGLMSFPQKYLNADPVWKALNK